MKKEKLNIPEKEESKRPTIIERVLNSFSTMRKVKESRCCANDSKKRTDLFPSQNNHINQFSSLFF